MLRSTIVLALFELLLTARLSAQPIQSPAAIPKSHNTIRLQGMGYRFDIDLKKGTLQGGLLSTDKRGREKPSPLYFLRRPLAFTGPPWAQFQGVVMEIDPSWNDLSTHCGAAGSPPYIPPMVLSGSSERHLQVQPVALSGNGYSGLLDLLLAHIPIAEEKNQAESLQLHITPISKADELSLFERYLNEIFVEARKGERTTRLVLLGHGEIEGRASLSIAGHISENSSNGPIVHSLPKTKVPPHLVPRIRVALAKTRVQANEIQPCRLERTMTDAWRLQDGDSRLSFKGDRSRFHWPAADWCNVLNNAELFEALEELFFALHPNAIHGLRE